MAGREPEDRVRFPMIRQGWRDVSFLHWPYEADVVQALLPDGFSVDLFDGVGWVSLTPFRVERSRLALTPPLPGASGFPETNLRTYVAGPDGVDGLWFLTLEADSLPIAAAAPAFVYVPHPCART